MKLFLFPYQFSKRVYNYKINIVNYPYNNDNSYSNF